ncbi:bifunctional metallophosphatase/5'-nucleotidase [Nocardioides mangrovi]|uniref:Bifunctional metallophosphatase/5'-nucleotidase n=1 Tax=Nocardioides mangrovi TaxID=2874580 RepID=A0ABS7UIA2_9ACTN|nr:bifunctional UDP-sugar hydrolase/5'-nucleotidase [Nocardioides mangrovi]MBZ5740368.1 bifunctional metallophosphatase/5'-nucleotidase [Nocardioides mangrovi]
MLHSSRAARSARALAAVSGVALVATSLSLISSPAHAADPVDINVLGINDFHGRIKSNGVEAGAAVLAGAVDQIRGEHPNTVFAAAGDLIGASTFESFIAHDKPTIDALNEAGLEVSAVGNHEFDQGYDDLVNRVMAPESADNPDGGAAWKYIGANVVMKDSGDPALDPTFVKTMDGVQVGFIGAVTEHLPELVSPGGIADIQVTDIVDAVNTEADALKADGVDVIVMLVHEGAPSTDCAAMDDDPTSDFGSIVTGVDDNVDAIISGHTHLAYNCSFPVAGWAGRPVTERPVVSAGQYGYNLNQLDLSVDPESGQIQSVDQQILPLTTKNADGTYTANYPVDADTKAIVDAAVTEADVKGAQPLGQIAGAFNRATRPTADGTGTEENRGGESTLGNLVAEAQRWATRKESTGAAQIAFMNPGGLRADMVGNNSGGYPAELTYKQAASVQPFANTLVNMTMSGAQIRTVLGQQWQPDGASRPFLRLGTSRGFKYTYDPTSHEITDMWLKGVPLTDDGQYSVTVNSFLSTGGDNFAEFANGTHKQDTGQTDLQGMVDYMAALASDDALPVDAQQRAVGVTGAAATYRLGKKVTFDVSSLAFTGAGDPQDKKVAIQLGQKKLGKVAVDNTVAPGATDDEAGTAHVAVKLPKKAATGSRTIKIVGLQTGTVVKVPVRITK